MFNDPVAVADTAPRAVEMALAMRETCTSTLAERWRDRGYDLDFVVGIAQGYATIGTVGFEVRRDYGVVGVVTDLAAALAAAARPGQVLITRRVLAALGTDVAAESAGTFALAGFSKTIDAYDVAGRNVGPAVEPVPAPPPSETPGANVFRCDGDVWTMAYQGKSFRMRGTRGLSTWRRSSASPGSACRRPSSRRSAAIPMPSA